MHALGPDWMDPQYLFDTYGTAFFWLSLVIVFVECGLFFPILPGDSLLFAIGVFIAGGELDINLVVAMAALFVAAFAGNVVGYEIGRALGAPLRERDGRIIRKEYFDKTHAFFEKHGAKALVLGRFVPIVRTYVTVVAGIGRMERRHFFTWSAVGAALWVVILTLAGYFLGSVQFIKDNLEAAILLIVLLSVLPMVIEYLRHRRQAEEIAEEVVADIREDLRDEHR
ncbi:MAG TPA: VTT domain-containing protein [Phycicoccus sp.]